MIAHFDKATTKWFREHPHNETTVMKCDKCGLFYKPSLEHKCPKKAVGNPDKLKGGVQE